MEYIKPNDWKFFKKFAGTIAKETDETLDIAPFIGDGNSLITKLTEIKDKGASVTANLLYHLTGQGVSGMGALRGQEESQIYGSDVVYIDELRNATVVPNKHTIGDMSVASDILMDAKENIKEWLQRAITAGFLNQIGGNTANQITTDGTYSGRAFTPVRGYNWFGMNAPTPPSKNRWVFVNNKKDESQLTKDDVLTLQMFDAMKTRALLAAPAIKPIQGKKKSSNGNWVNRLPGGAKYVVFLHPVQAMQLRTNTDVGQWLDVTKAIYATRQEDTPIANGSLGIYNEILFVENKFVPYGVNKDGTPNLNVHRAIFCGAQAAFYVAGSYDRDTLTSVNIHLDLQDYQNKVGVQGGKIFGIKKSIFSKEGIIPNVVDREDYGTIVLSSWAPDTWTPDSTTPPVQPGS